MSGGIHRIPSRPHEMTGMKGYRSCIAASGRLEEQLFDRGFLDSVIADSPPRHGLRDCTPRVRRQAMHPHRAAVKQQRPPRPQRVDQLLRTRRGEADKIDNCIRTQTSDARSKRSRLVLGPPIDLDATNGCPRRMLDIRLTLAATRSDDLMPRFDQSRNEKSADVTGRAYDDNSHAHNVHSRSASRLPPPAS